MATEQAIPEPDSAGVGYDTPIDSLSALRYYAGPPISSRATNQIISLHLKHEAALRGSKLEVLEAGCGWHWPLHRDARFRITGLDLDRKALDRRLRVKKDLHEAAHGDICDSSAVDGQFDAVTCFFVLEHVKGAEKAIGNLASWTKPGGILVLKFPNPESVYGFFTRITPLWVHVLFHRYVHGDKNAGKPGYAPYPTYYDNVLYPTKFFEFVHSKGLRVVDHKICGKEPWILRIFMQVVQALTLGKLRARELSLMYVLRKA